MPRPNWRHRFVRFAIAGTSLFAVGGCLTDQQTTTILTGVITSGLSALVNLLVSGLAGSTPAA